MVLFNRRQNNGGSTRRGANGGGRRKDRRRPPWACRTVLSPPKRLRGARVLREEEPATFCRRLNTQLARDGVVSWPGSDGRATMALDRPNMIDYSLQLEHGSVPEWTKGTDCKSVGVRLRWFESTRSQFFIFDFRSLIFDWPSLSWGEQATRGAQIQNPKSKIQNPKSEMPPRA